MKTHTHRANNQLRENSATVNPGTFRRCPWGVLRLQELLCFTRSKVSKVMSDASNRTTCICIYIYIYKYTTITLNGSSSKSWHRKASYWQAILECISASASFWDPNPAFLPGFLVHSFFKGDTVNVDCLTCPLWCQGNTALQLWPKMPVISTYSPIYRRYNPIEITSHN